MGSRLEANSSAVRKRIEKHKFKDEGGEEYEASKFGGFNDYFRRKKIKLQNLDAETRSSSANNPPIFKGVVAHVNGYTQPSLNDLHILIVSYGGGFMQYLDGKTTVTHIIASNLTPKKKVEFSRYRIVKPAWVVDSVEAGKLLPWDAYRVVEEVSGQRVLGFENGIITSQVNSLSGGYRDQTDTSWYTAQVKDVADELNARDEQASHFTIQASQEGNTPHGLYGTHHNAQSPIQFSPDDDMYDTVTSDVPQAGDGEFKPDASQELDQRFTQSQSGDHGKERPLEPPNFSHDKPSALSYNGSGMLDDPTIADSKAKKSLNDDYHPDRRRDGHPVNHSQPDHHVTDQNNLTDEPTKQRSLEPRERLLLDDALIEDSNDDRVPNSPDIQNSKSVIPRIPTAEEHNALLLADPRVRKSTVVNPEFLKQYYEESRLHHLSAWKADLKSRLQKLAAEKTSSQRSKETSLSGSRRYILHVDFDSFFASVSLKKFPQYVDKPVVVAHGGGAGSEIASCNYPARKFGIKNGMWMKHAQKMCPDLKVLPYDFPSYENASRDFYDAIIDTGGIVQSVSVDEALVDVSARCIAAGGHNGKGIHEGSIWREQAEADKIATNLRDNIREKTGCAVSIGIGGNILLAKVALRKAKPAGQYHIKPEEVLDFLGSLTLQELPGVAYSIGGKLEEIGVKYVKDVRELSKERMITTLGPKTGEKIWDYSRGIDRTAVGEQVIRKSVSAEVNWGIRFVTQDQAEEFIQSLCEELHKRLIMEQVKGRQLTIKIMRRAPDAPLDPPKHLGHGKCDTYNKSLILGVATNDQEILGREAISILRGFGFSPGELRGLGVQMQRLEPIKGTAENPQDSSQKKLQFKTSSACKPRAQHEDITPDDTENPQKPKVPAHPHPAAVLAKETSPSGESQIPLNALGTQFIMPTQVDPEVYEELPQDIRSKLLHEQTNPKAQESREDSPLPRSRSSTPAPLADAIPAQSQLDKATLDALPPDVRAEILAFYDKSPQKRAAQAAQALLPQSPRNSRSIKLPKKLTTPTKKRTRLFSRSNKDSASGFSTLTQSNFVANPRPGSSSSKTSVEGPPDDIPDDFLAALPDDIRREVLAQARRDRLQKKGGIDLTASKRKRPPTAPQHPVGQRTLTLPPLPPKPTFTAQKFTRLPDLRGAITAWFDEFRGEGPYVEDVDVLAKFLQRVVLDEQDMDKAVSVARWMAWVVDEGDEKGAWKGAVRKVRESVQIAVKERGLGKVEL